MSRHSHVKQQFHDELHALQIGIQCERHFVMSVLHWKTCPWVMNACNISLHDLLTNMEYCIGYWCSAPWTEVHFPRWFWCKHSNKPFDSELRVLNFASHVNENKSRLYDSAKHVDGYWTLARLPCTFSSLTCSTQLVMVFIIMNGTTFSEDVLTNTYQTRSTDKPHVLHNQKPCERQDVMAPSQCETYCWVMNACKVSLHDLVRNMQYCIGFWCSASWRNHIFLNYLDTSISNSYLIRNFMSCKLNNHVNDNMKCPHYSAKHVVWWCRILRCPCTIWS